MEGNGPASGNSNLFRAEAYGMHAALLVLSLFLCFTGSAASELDIWYNNQSLINRMKNWRNFRKPFPNYSTVSEWDQLESIQSHIEALQVTPTFQHIRGHQNDTNSNLTFEKELNVHADFLAGQQINWDVKSRIRVIPDVISKCHFHIHGCTITSYYKTNIRDAATAPDLQQWLMSHCRISATDGSLID